MLRVLRQRDFSLLWFAGLISMIGDWMLIVALPITVYQLTDSPVATSGVLIASRIPSLFLGSVAGVFIDRWDRRRTMVIVNLLRAPVLLLLLAVNTADTVWIVYVVSFVVSAMSQFFGPAENALLPTLVDKEDLVPANALNGLNNNLARLAGPAVGGLVAGLYGLDGVVIVDTVSFLLAAAFIAAIARTPGLAREQHSDLASPRNLGKEWVAGLRLIRSRRVLMVVFGVMAMSGLGEGFFSSLFWVFVDEALEGGSMEAGWLMSAQAVGGLLGSLVVGRWARGVSPIRLLGWGAIGLGIADLGLFNYPAVASGIWLGLMFLCLAGFPVSAFSTGFTTIIQTEAEDAYRGRVFGALSTTMGLLMILGASIAGPLTERFGVVPVLTAQAAAYPIGGILALTAMGEWGGSRNPLQRNGPVVAAGDAVDE